MPWYDFKCPKCLIVSEIQVPMSDIGDDLKVYCVNCSVLTEEQMREHKWSEYNLPLMYRLYSNNICIKGNNLGSLIETKKFRSTNSRPKEWHDEQIKNKQIENQRIEEREIKIKDV